ncbi:Ead domain protein [Klebsiella pneumoniae]|uniref:ead/Ea22-like family protein n=1 Tax=Klebsiella pneumoniae TaxID=573 RepID=UPI000E2D6B78|nr:ead/Ea22-like family protein [Klebsiella pneumoniae]SWF49472.1 Ead domain protein [Klebsiella pneumoniae]
MTDITELAQSLKAAAEKWQEAWGKYDKVEITIAEFIRAANQYESIVKDPANILALVEALEKSEKTSEARREAIGITHKRAARERDRANAAEEALEKAQAQSSKWLEAYHKAVSIGARYEERIAELESRTVTVKLPPKIERNDADGWFMYNCGRVGGGAAEWYNKALDDVGAELTAAGIKVEAE